MKIKESLSWDKVEKLIQDEMRWLDSSVSTFFTEAKDTAGRPICKNCVLRKIALLIIYGEVEAKEITKENGLKDFWKPGVIHTKGKKHGQEWHSSTMAKIESHFLSQNFEVEKEPDLNWGRADLGAYKKENPPLLIEVGTTSLYKICMNLSDMKNFVYLLVPDDERLIEFRKK